jgi:hypothetical protein
MDGLVYDEATSSSFEVTKTNGETMDGSRGCCSPSNQAEAEPISLPCPVPAGANSTQALADCPASPEVDSPTCRSRSGTLPPCPLCVAVGPARLASWRGGSAAGAKLGAAAASYSEVGPNTKGRSGGTRRRGNPSHNDSRGAKGLPRGRRATLKLLFPAWNRAFRCIWMLEELGVPYELVQSAAPWSRQVKEHHGTGASGGCGCGCGGGFFHVENGGSDRRRNVRGRQTVRCVVSCATSTDGVRAPRHGRRLFDALFICPLFSTPSPGTTERAP